MSQAFLGYPSVKRSLHPTNSCLAVGPLADFILNGHDEKSSSYLPYLRIIEVGGKNLMLGCLHDSAQSPMALHAAQEHLGITKGNWQSGTMQSYYYNNRGSLDIFTRQDYGGCTSYGFKTMWHHVVKKAVIFGNIGLGLSAYIDCKKSFDIFIDLYKHDLLTLKCNNLKCPDCWGSPIYKNPLFWLKLVYLSLIRKCLKLIKIIFRK